MHRVGRSEVRSPGNGRLPRRPGTGGDCGSSTMKKTLLLLPGVLALAGCSRLDMQDQPKYRPQRPSDFFADGRSERQPVEGTIARGALNEDTAFYEGKDAAGKDVEA